MAWRVAPSVQAALDQANRLWPHRRRTSDGTIGDQAHASRTSDHNPGARDLVHAFDLTHDPVQGADCAQLAETLRLRTIAGLERRVRYIIWSRRVFNPSVSREWRAYMGSNPHTSHMHVSIHSTIDAENDTSPWWVASPSTPAEAVVCRRTLNGAAVALKLIHIKTDGVGDGSYPVANYLAHTTYAPSDKYAGTGDRASRVGPVIGARLADGGTVRLVVAGGPANAEVLCLVLLADE